VEHAVNRTYVARAFTVVDGALARPADGHAQLADEAYVEALARVVYYWAYPAVDLIRRTSQWEIMKAGPGTIAGLFPAGPVSTMGYLADFVPRAQRMIVTPNHDTIDGVAIADLGREPAVVQTPSNVPDDHYWSVQITDVFTSVVHQLGSAARTPGGKFLLVGPSWHGKKPTELVDVLRMPTNIAVVVGRSFAGDTPESKARSLAVLGQIRAYPFGEDEPGVRTADVRAIAANARFPTGVTAESIAAAPHAFRPRWVEPKTFWDALERMLSANPIVGPSDAPMADQARALIALRKSGPRYEDLLDRAAIVAHGSLHAASRYEQVGVDAGNGWQRQEDGGVWGTDWFGRAQAAVVYILVNDHHEAIYFLRGTDRRGELLEGQSTYTMTFAKDALPPMDRKRGGFWSLTMYDQDYFMLPESPNGRTRIGTVDLDADELKLAADGSLTITMSRAEPADAIARANWLPAPEGPFALVVRAYVPVRPLVDGTYRLPNVERGRRRSTP
jgi:hypothetical protein